VSKGVFWLS